MASNPNEVRQAAMRELARREMTRRQSLRPGQSGEFKGPIATGEEMATSRTEQTMRKLGLIETARLTATPTQRLGIGALEGAASVATGMVATPLNHLWNAGMEAAELPTGQPVGMYQPRTPEGQAVLSGVDKAMRATRIPQAIEAGMDLDNPDPAKRATGNLIGAGLSIMPAVGPMRAARARRAMIPTRDAIKAASGELYAGARGTGEMLPQSGFPGLIQKAEKMLAEESFDPAQNPRTAAALNRLYEEGTRPGIQGFSPQGAEVIRRHLMNAEESAIGDIKNPAQSTSADARLAAKLLDDFDDFMDAELAKAGPQYQKARALWSTQRKAADIERLFERAKNQAGQYSVSGMDNALRTQFKGLADNHRRFNRFSAPEKEAILRVVRGDLPQNWLQRLGKFSVSRGGVSAMPALLGMSLDPTLGAILAIGGEAARVGSSALRSSRAGAVDRLVRAGAIPAMPGDRLPIPRAQSAPGILPAAAVSSNALYREQEQRRNALAR